MYKKSEEMIPYYNSQFYFRLSKPPYASCSCPCMWGTDQHTEGCMWNIIWHCLSCNSTSGVQKKGKDKGTRTERSSLKYISWNTLAPVTLSFHTVLLENWRFIHRTNWLSKNEAIARHWGRATKHQGLFKPRVWILYSLWFVRAMQWHVYIFVNSTNERWWHC